MSATKRRGQSRPVLADEANMLTTAIRADGQTGAGRRERHRADSTLAGGAKRS